MDPLSAVEDILGNVESWPNSTIIDIFVTKPNATSVQNVAAFMYGNGVSVKKAVDCFVACIGIDLYFASCTMKNWYAAWDNHPYTAHFAKYYDVALKRWTWLNGKALSQHEAVRPKDYFIAQFGTEHTGCPLIINTTINHIRSSTTVV